MGNQAEQVTTPVSVSFQTELAGLLPHQVYGLPDLSHLITHEAKYVRPNVPMRPGMFVHDDALDPDMNRSQVRQSNFTLQPANRLGREKSHNEVFFGRLAFSDGTHDVLAERQVAVKPVKSLSAGLGELALFQHMRNLNLPTFKPLGLTVTGSEMNFLITEFSRPVATMDSVEWHSLDVEEKWEQVRHATDTLALLHSNLLFHGDAEFKNIAFNDTGNTVIVDPELMVSTRSLVEAVIDAKSPDSGEAITALNALMKIMSADFTSVCRSVDTFVIGTIPSESRPKTEVAKFKQYKKNIYNPYRNALTAISSPYSQVLLKAYDRLLAYRKNLAQKGVA